MLLWTFNWLGVPETLRCVSPDSNIILPPFNNAASKYRLNTQMNKGVYGL